MVLTKTATAMCLTAILQMANHNLAMRCQPLVRNISANLRKASAMVKGCLSKAMASSMQVSLSRVWPGLGRFVDNDGGVYVGQFDKGEPAGLGSYIGADGTVVQGRLKDRKPDGMLLITTPDGKQRLEIWRSGEKLK